MAKIIIIKIKNIKKGNRYGRGPKSKYPTKIRKLDLGGAHTTIQSTMAPSLTFMGSRLYGAFIWVEIAGIGFGLETLF